MIHDTPFEGRTGHAYNLAQLYRNVIAERYADLIEALERADDSVSITNTVTYQDGTSVKRTIVLKIRDLDGYQPPKHKNVRPVWSGRR